MSPNTMLDNKNVNKLNIRDKLSMLSPSFDDSNNISVISPTNTNLGIANVRNQSSAMHNHIMMGDRNQDLESVLDKMSQ